MTPTLQLSTESMSPSQRVIYYLAMSQKYPKAGYGKEAAKVINNHTAAELFKPDENPIFRKNVLHYAIEAGDTKNALALITKEGVTPAQLYHQETRSGQTPLHSAISYGNETVALALINQKGVKSKEHLELKTKLNKTAYTLAEEKGLKKITDAIEKRILNLMAEATQSQQPAKYKTTTHRLRA